MMCNSVGEFDIDLVIFASGKGMNTSAGYDIASSSMSLISYSTLKLFKRVV